MKKLLAMILCVAMVLSIAPAAFADPGVGSAESGWASKTVNSNAIDNLKDSINSMYAALAVNQTVFGTAKAMHDLTDGMVKALFADTDSVDFGDHVVYHDDLVANARAYLKGIIGGEINNYIDKRIDAMTDADGNVDAEDYLKLYTKAVSNALTSAKAQKGFEAFYYAIAVAKIADDLGDALDDLYDEMVDWNDFGSKWAEFGFANDETLDLVFTHGVPTTAEMDDIDDDTDTYDAVWAALS